MLFLNKCVTFFFVIAYIKFICLSNIISAITPANVSYTYVEKKLLKILEIKDKKPVNKNYNTYLILKSTENKIKANCFTISVELESIPDDSNNINKKSSLNITTELTERFNKEILTLEKKNILFIIANQKSELKYPLIFFYPKTDPIIIFNDIYKTMKNKITNFMNNEKEKALLYIIKNNKIYIYIVNNDNKHRLAFTIDTLEYIVLYKSKIEVNSIDVFNYMIKQLIVPEKKSIKSTSISSPIMNEVRTNNVHVNLNHSEIYLSTIIENNDDEKDDSLKSSSYSDSFEDSDSSIENANKYKLNIKKIHDDEQEEQENLQENNYAKNEIGTVKREIEVVERKKFSWLDVFSFKGNKKNNIEGNKKPLINFNKKPRIPKIKFRFFKKGEDESKKKSEKESENEYFLGKKKIILDTNDLYNDNSKRKKELKLKKSICF